MGSRACSRRGPAVRGLGVPGTPDGAPGIDGPSPRRFVVWAFSTVRDLRCPMHILKWFPKEHAEAMPVSESGRSRGCRQSTVKYALFAALLAISAFGLTRAFAYEYVYKWKDAKGNTVYSDHAPSGVATERVVVDSRHSDTEAAQARGDAERAQWARADAEREEQKKKEEAQRQEKEKQRAVQCREARSRNARFGIDGRHFRIDENGERVYYSAEEIDRERAEAKKQMDEFCTPSSGRRQE